MKIKLSKLHEMLTAAVEDFAERADHFEEDTYDVERAYASGVQDGYAAAYREIRPKLDELVRTVEHLGITNEPVIEVHINDGPAPRQRGCM